MTHVCAVLLHLARVVVQLLSLNVPLNDSWKRLDRNPVLRQRFRNNSPSEHNNLISSSSSLFSLSRIKRRVAKLIYSKLPSFNPMRGAWSRRNPFFPLHCRIDCVLMWQPSPRINFGHVDEEDVCDLCSIWARGRTLQSRGLSRGKFFGQTTLSHLHVMLLDGRF